MQVNYVFMVLFAKDDIAIALKTYSKSETRNNFFRLLIISFQRVKL